MIISGVPEGGISRDLLTLASKTNKELLLGPCRELNDKSYTVWYLKLEW